jgi:hypothetical protein
MAIPDEEFPKNDRADASGRYQWREAYACAVLDSNVAAIKSLTEPVIVAKGSSNQLNGARSLSKSGNHSGCTSAYPENRLDQPIRRASLRPS